MNSDMTIYGSPCQKCGEPSHGARPCRYEGLAEKLLKSLPGEHNMMRAKMQVQSVTKHHGGAETVKMSAVTGKGPFGAEGASEDNTYARYTPSGSVELNVNNPALAGKIEPGKKFYVDFTEAPE